jgi:maltose-binding protein MalE
MFRSVTMAVIACASVLALVATPASAAAKTKTAKEHSLVGTLQKVDGQTLTVKTSTGAAELVTLTSNAHITKDGKVIQASQLSSDTGAHVKVRYTESNGQKQADAVTVSQPTTTTAKK